MIVPTLDLVAGHFAGGRQTWWQGTLQGADTELVAGHFARGGHRPGGRASCRACWRAAGMLEGRHRPGGRAFWLCSGGRSSAQSPPPGTPHHCLQGRAPGGTWPDTREGTWAGPYDRACHSTAAPPCQLQMPARRKQFKLFAQHAALALLMKQV